MNNNYYVVKSKALPEVFLKVAEAKELLDSGKVSSVSDATEMVGLSRSSFYKYKDDIFPFNERVHGTTVTLSIQVEDKPGSLSNVLKTVAEYNANILTIHQSIPVSGIATISLSLEIRDDAGDFSAMVSELEELNGIKTVKILAKEQ